MQRRSIRFEKQTLLAVLSVATLGLTALFAVTGLEFLVPTTFVLGFFVVIPLIALLGEALPVVESEVDGVEVEREPSADGPIDDLRSRYARGELTDEEFERRLERLLETEDAEANRSRERVFDRE